MPDSSRRWTATVPLARFADAVGWLIVLAPFLLYAATLPQFGRLQRNDYWNDFRHVLEADGTLTLNPLSWLTARSNEHQIGLHLPIWHLNGLVTRGDNRALSLVSLVYLVGAFAILYRALPATVRAKPAARVLHGTFLSGLLATPAAAHNWVMGFSGNQWYLVNFLAVASLATVLRGSADPTRLAWQGGGLFALASISHGTFLALGPPLLLATWLRRLPRRGSILVACAVTIVTLLYAANYDRPAEHPQLARDPLVVAAGVFEHVGAIGSESAHVARRIGALGILLFALGAVPVLRERPREASRGTPPEVLWWSIALFALGTAIGTSVGRSGFGEGFAAGSSRYASLPALFWLGSVMALIVRGSKAKGGAYRFRRIRPALFIALGALILAANAGLGLRRLHRHLSDVQNNAVVELAMRWRVWDPEMESRIVHQLLPTSRRYFERLRHIPFDDPSAPTNGSRRAEPRSGPASSSETGFWLSATPIDSRWARVEGWALPVDARRRRVLFLSADRVVRGAAVFVPETATGPRLLFAPPRPSGRWIGYLPIDSIGTVRATVEIDGEPGFVALHSGPAIAAAALSRDE